MSTINSSDNINKWMGISVYLIVILFQTYSVVTNKTKLWTFINSFVLMIGIIPFITSPFMSLRFFSNRLNNKLLNIDYTTTQTPKIIAVDYYTPELIQKFKENNIIPGTHHSMSYKLGGPVTSMSLLQVSVLLNIPPVKQVVVDIAKTQNRTLRQQFEDGIRFFDVRVSRLNNVYYVDHNLVICEFVEFVNELFLLLTNNPNETVYLKIKKSRFNPPEEDFDPNTIFTTLFLSLNPQKNIVLRDNLSENIVDGDIVLVTNDIISFPNSDDMDDIVDFTVNNLESDKPIIESIYTYKTKTISLMFTSYILLSFGLAALVTGAKFKKIRKTKKLRKSKK